MTRAEEIAANLQAVRHRVADGLAAAGRSPDSVRLLAVSKTVVPEDIVAALAAGQQGSEAVREELIADERKRAEGDPVEAAVA